MKRQNQHYVPEVLLKEFTTNGDGFFFSLNLKYKHISLKNVSGVCYSIDYYDINDVSMQKRYDLNDNSRFLENSFFRYENDLVKKKLSLFKNRVNKIQQKDIEFIIEAYLEIKQRNPFYIMVFETPEIIDHYIEETIKDAEEYSKIDPLVKRYNVDIESWLSWYRNERVKNPDYRKEVHLGGLVNSNRNKNHALNETKSRLSQMNFILVEADEEDFFIISDNPGYTLKYLKDDETLGVFNADFGKFEGVFFPINSKQGIMFGGNSMISNQARDIEYVKVSSAQVLDLNKNSLYHTNGTIFCESKEYLKSFAEKIK